MSDPSWLLSSALPVPYPSSRDKVLEAGDEPLPVCVQSAPISLSSLSTAASRESQVVRREIEKVLSSRFPVHSLTIQMSCSPTRIPPVFYPKTLRTSQLLRQLPKFDRPLCAAPQFLRNQQKKSEKLMIQYDAHCSSIHHNKTCLDSSVNWILHSSVAVFILEMYV